MNWLESPLPIGSKQCQRPTASTAGWSSRATSGHSGSTRKRRNAWHPEWGKRDGPPPLDAGALGGVCSCCWVEVLAHHQPVPEAPAWSPVTNRTVQAGTGADLDQKSADDYLLSVRQIHHTTSASSTQGRSALNTRRTNSTTPAETAVRLVSAFASSVMNRQRGTRHIE